MPHRLRILSACLLAAVALTAGCSQTDEPKVIVDDAWVRTTDGAKDTSMTALFLTATNPGSKPDRLLSATCSSVAGVTEVHEMATVEGKKVMRAAKNGIEVPAESHVHLAPGGFHIMLMKLTKPLPVGDEIECTVTFERSGDYAVKATAKAQAEEEEHYHP